MVRERAERHWWLKNAGFKLVAGKFIFRSKKIGGSRKVNWWLRNFRPTRGDLEHLTIETRLISESFECVMGECVL